MARRGASLLVLMLALGACSSSSPSRASTPKTAADATQRCAAYQKTHYPKDRAHARITSRNVVCVIEIGPVVSCTSSSPGLFERTTYPKEMVVVEVAADGTGHVVQTFRQQCSADQTMTTSG